MQLPGHALKNVNMNLDKSIESMFVKFKKAIVKFDQCCRHIKY